MPLSPHTHHHTSHDLEPICQSLIFPSHPDSTEFPGCRRGFKPHLPSGLGVGGGNRYFDLKHDLALYLGFRVCI